MLTTKITTIADKTRKLTGLTNKMTLDEIAANMDLIKTDPILQDKSIEITENGTTNIVADEGYDGLNNVDVTVNVASSGGDEMVKYSTEEQVVGTWIDGKPLYRKVVLVTFPKVNTDGTFPESPKLEFAENVDFARIIDGSILVTYEQGAYQSFPLPVITNSGRIAKIQISVTVDRKAHLVITTNAVAFSKSTGYAVVEYTKTTD